MPRLLELARFTFREVLLERAFMVLLGLILLTPLAAAIFSNLFLFEIGKVRVDFLLAVYRLIASAFLIFIAIPLLGRDIGDRQCHLFLFSPVQRHEYLFGRFFGLLAALGVLALVATLSAEALIGVTLWMEPEPYRHGLNWHAGFSIAGLTFYQHISLLAAMILICSFATGLPEMLVMACGFIGLTWSLPPVLQAMQTAEVMQHTPAFVAMLIKGAGALLPTVNAGQLGLAIAHGLDVPTAGILANLAEHGAYAIIMLALAWRIFDRRDL
ncbi:MAG: hypothetical protein D6816_07940 [Bacteroidetes bacterium]|nr:MAG: hypothetical protein D6816_07940 [Bacteroidota bacterium]